MLLLTILRVVDLLISVISTVVIVQFVMGLLIAFEVINTRNNAVVAIWQSLNAILDPLLRPIRRIMPSTGAIDFSPLVLIVLLRIVTIVLSGLAASGY